MQESNVHIRCAHLNFFNFVLHFLKIILCRGNDVIRWKVAGCVGLEARGTRIFHCCAVYCDRSTWKRLDENGTVEVKNFM